MPENAPPKQAASLRIQFISDLRAGRLALPVLPQSAQKLLALCNDDNCTPTQLAEYTSQDQAICAHVLRLANSAAYSPKVEIASVQLAIARLGLKTLREICMAITMKQEVFKIAGWEESIAKMWQASVVRRGYGKEIAAKLGLGRERAVMSGLLQDIGKPITLFALNRICEERGWELERKDALGLMNKYHSQVGALALRTWQLPEWLQAAVLYHHAWEDAEEYLEEAVVANLADCFSEIAEKHGEYDGDRIARLMQAVNVGFSQEDVDFLLAQADSVLESAESFA
jgi:HD-like signal output (HDOD) protein